MLKRFFLITLFLISRVSYSLDLELTQGINAALPIGIAEFGSHDAQGSVSQVVGDDLHLSGQFKIINSGSNNNINQWQQLGADSVLTGDVSALGNNRYQVEFKLLDAQAQGRVLLAKSYQVNQDQLRALSHHISDEVYQKLTGQRGVFSSRIAYILVQRQGQQTRYSLEIADVDGANPRRLLLSSEPIMSPTWSPDGRNIAYVSFEKKRAQVFSVSVETGQRRLLTDFPGINGAPAWSPDGHQLAVVLSKSGAPKLYSLNLDTGSMKQLTFGASIDTEPRYSPDGRSILFTSGRGGSPQIYRLSLSDGQISRVTYVGNYNARASFTPNQQNIVVLHRADKAFNIGVQSVASGQMLQITNSGMDESPSLAPNGRIVLYATHYNGKGILGMASIDGRIKIRLPAHDGDVQEPAWSPYFG